jgi:biopolymer transport protein TolR
MSLSRMKERRSRKKTNPATLNLVSLMDIFTILVFFLMLNSSEVEMLETSGSIKLPDSTSEKRPENRIVISVSADDLIVQGRRVASVKEALRTADPLIAGLKTELDYQAGRRKQSGRDFAGSVTILGDRNLPYELLKRIMTTCQHADFTKIALAVNQVSGEGA